MDVSTIAPYTLPLNQPQSIPIEPKPMAEPRPEADSGSSGTTPPVPENIPKVDFYA